MTVFYLDIHQCLKDRPSQMTSPKEISWQEWLATVGINACHHHRCYFWKHQECPLINPSSRTVSCCLRNLPLGGSRHLAWAQQLVACNWKEQWWWTLGSPLWHSTGFPDLRKSHSRKLSNNAEHLVSLPIYQSQIYNQLEKKKSIPVVQRGLCLLNTRERIIQNPNSHY